MLGALIGAGASLLGGVLGNRASKKAHDKDTYNNSPQGIRANAEAAGFNPLIFAGPGTGTGARYTPAFSNPLAGAGAILSDGYYQQEQLKIQKAELEQENQRLENMAKKFSLTPPIPGLYGGQYGARTKARTSGVAGSAASSVSAGDADGSNTLGATGAIVAPGREVEVAKYASGPGLTEINNAITGGGVVVPGADGEPWGIDEVATGVLVGGPQVMWNYGKKLGGRLADIRFGHKMYRLARESAQEATFGHKWPKHWGGSIPRQISPTSAEKQKFAYRQGVLR